MKSRGRYTWIEILVIRPKIGLVMSYVNGETGLPWINEASSEVEGMYKTFTTHLS